VYRVREDGSEHLRSEGLGIVCLVDRDKLFACLFQHRPPPLFHSGFSDEVFDHPLRAFVHEGGCHFLYFRVPVPVFHHAADDLDVDVGADIFGNARIAERVEVDLPCHGLAFFGSERHDEPPCVYSGAWRREAGRAVRGASEERPVPAEYDWRLTCVCLKVEREQRSIYNVHRIIKQSSSFIYLIEYYLRMRLQPGIIAVFRLT
jgi:hypothetical protein